MAEHQLPKLNTGVRFPSSALDERLVDGSFGRFHRMWTIRRWRSCHIRATSDLALPSWPAVGGEACASCRPAATKRAIRSMASGGPRRRRSDEGPRRQLPRRHSHRPRAWAPGSTRRPAVRRWPTTPSSGSPTARTSAPGPRELYRSLLRLHVLPVLGSTSSPTSRRAGPLMARRPDRGRPPRRRRRSPSRTGCSTPSAPPRSRTA